MKFLPARLTAVGAAIMMLLGILVVTPGTAGAAGPCKTNPGKRQPVIFVHGLNSNPSVWGSDSDDASMVHALDKLPNVHITTFDYSAYSTQWVTNDHIGPALAREISCEADVSRASGGLGKVVVIGHSMGGLATRFAAAQKVNGQSVSNDIGLVVTIGTPNLGSGLANAGVEFIRSLCLPGQKIWCDNLAKTKVSALYGLADGSPELKALPWLPRNIPTLAIAGDVTLRFHLFKTVLSQDFGSDLVVSKSSALQDIRKLNDSGGSSTVSCDENVPLTHSLPACWHSNLPHNSTAEQQVVDAVKHYLSYAATAPFIPFSKHDWGRHSSTLKFTSSGTATMFEGMGYGYVDGCGYWCAFNANLKLTANSDGSVTGTYSKVWFTGVNDPNGHTTHIVQNPSSETTEGTPRVGQTTHFSLEPHDMLGIDGHPYWCGPDTTLQWWQPCGA